jgi:hypothetical protein
MGLETSLHFLVTETKKREVKVSKKRRKEDKGQQKLFKSIGL